MRSAAPLALLLLALAGCTFAFAGVQRPGPPVQGPTDLGQPLSIDVQNSKRGDLHLRFTLANQPEVGFHMTAGCRGGECVVPHVATAYVGSIPPGSEVVVREGEREVRLVVEDRGGPVWLLVDTDSSTGSLTLGRYDQQPGYD